MTKPLTAKHLSFMMLNYVIGFGFIATIGKVLDLGGWGILVFFITAFIAFGAIAVYAKLAHDFPDNKYSSYGFSKRINGRGVIFFQGWNHYIQGPVISIATPLFLEGVLKAFWPNQETVWKIVAIVLFVVLVLMALFEFIKINFVFKAISSAKWIILFIGFILATIISAKDVGFSSNWLHSDKATIMTMTGAILVFIFSFGGIESVATTINQVSVKSFRKTFFWTFLIILALYLMIFIVIFGINIYARHINLQKRGIIQAAYNISLGGTGIVLFCIGIVANKASVINHLALINAAIMIPLANDRFLPSWLGKVNSKGSHKNAIITSTIVTLLIFLMFELLEVYVPQESPFFNAIAIGGISFFAQYLLITITLFRLFITKQIKHLAIWEALITSLMTIGIAFVLFVQIFPPVIGQAFTNDFIIKDSVYFGLIGLGYLIWLINKMTLKKQRKTSN